MVFTREVARAIKLSENFRLEEFVNWKAGGRLDALDYRLIDGLQFCRDIFGVPMRITSGFRTKEFNKSVGGYYKSYHLTGQASDFKMDFTGWNKASLLRVFKQAGFSNVKFYYRKDAKGNWYLHRCHVDVGKSWDGSGFYVSANKYE